MQVTYYDCADKVTLETCLRINALSRGVAVIVNDGKDVTFEIEGVLL